MSGPKNWSVSAAQRLETCLHAFKLQYVDRVPRPASEVPLHWRKGTVVHSALEAVWRKRQAEQLVGPMWTLDNWELAKTAIATAWAKEEMPDPADSDGIWDDVHEAVETTLKAESESHEHIYAVEHKFFLRAGMNIIGFADLLRRPEVNWLHIRDWKVRRAASEAAKLEKDFQLNLYAEMARRTMPWVERVTGSHYNPPTAVEVTVELTPEEGAAALHRIQTARDIAAHETEWAPETSSACNNCAYKPICPAWERTGAQAAMDVNSDLF